MVDQDRRPTAQEIEELIDLVRRDPGSPAFIDLGEAYLALGRPRDAVQVGNVGLEAAPDNLEGRVMLARAFVALHQWKDAQGELLRVVKVDRSNRQGFALLGEVLLRRSDFERAVPVLQHAQNLDPTSPAILSMLRRARASQPLDPPPPVPNPVPPRGETDNRDEIQRSRSMPTPVAPGAPPGGRSRQIGVPPPPPQHAMPAMPTASPMMPTLAIEPGAAAGHDAAAGFAAQPQSTTGRSGHKPTAPPPLSVEGVRPRIVSSAKVQNAAAASLRQSAAVGENYLNDLLTGGLLDVAGVRVPEAEYDLRPDRRWGRSTRRAFIFLFVVLVLGIGGGGTWWWWSEKQTAEAVARLQKESKLALGAGDYNGLTDALAKLTEALKRDNANTLSFAYTVEAGGLAALLYGAPVDEVDRAYKLIANELKPGEPGARELVIGKAAMELARLHVLQAPATALGEVQKLVDDYLADRSNPEQAKDRWAQWLKGRALLSAGQRDAARAAFKLAADSDGLVVAMVDLANLMVDDGQLEEARALFKKANDKSKDHPLVVLGDSLARAEASVEINEAIEDLNAKLIDNKIPPRVAAYRYLALALANINIDEYPQAVDSLRKATAGKPSGEPRFWARVAWAHYALGDLAAAAAARAKCVWYATKPQAEPTVQLVDAGLLLASGVPEKALEVAAKIEGVRPRLLRTQALLDLGKPRDAIGEADELLKVAPKNIQAQILREEARMIALEGKDRTAASEALESLARSAKSKLGRHSLGIARLAIGSPEAKSALEVAIADVSDVSPNPLAYRTLTALAEIALAENNLLLAGRYLDWALDPEPGHRLELELSNRVKIRALDPDKGNARTVHADYIKANSGYFPTRALQARVVLRNNDPNRAWELLQPLLNENAAMPPSVQLTLAEVLVRRTRPAPDKDGARRLVTDLRTAPGIVPAELARVAALIDPDLVKELDLPEPAEPDAPDQPRGRPRPRRGR